MVIKHTKIVVLEDTEKGTKFCRKYVVSPDKDLKDCIQFTTVTSTFPSKQIIHIIFDVNLVTRELITYNTTRKKWREVSSFVRCTESVVQ